MLCQIKRLLLEATEAIGVNSLCLKVVHSAINWKLEAVVMQSEE